MERGKEQQQIQELITSLYTMGDVGVTEREMTLRKYGVSNYQGDCHRSGPVATEYSFESQNTDISSLETYSLLTYTLTYLRTYLLTSLLTSFLTHLLIYLLTYLLTRTVPKDMSNSFLHVKWEQQTKESAVVDGTSCCVILECLVTSIVCIT